MTEARKKRLEEGLLKVGEMAGEAGVLKSTVTYYTQLGLLNAAARTGGGHRLYRKQETLKKILFIRKVTRRRFRVNELKIGA